MDRYGWQGGFEFRGAPVTLQARLADAVLACPMDAGTRDGEPVAMWVTLPLRLEVSPPGDATGRAGARRR